MPSKSDIVAYARTLKGTPFKHQGRTPGVGLDCIGSLVAVGRHFDICDYDVKAYSSQPDGFSLIEELDKCLVAPYMGRREDDPGPWGVSDVLVFWYNHRSKPRHVAIVTPGFSTEFGILHTYYNSGEVVEHDFTDWWMKRLVKAYSWQL